MAAVDTTYDITGVTLLTGEAVSVLTMVQNMSRFACAIYFTDTPPVLGAVPDLIWPESSYESAFPIPNGPLNVYGAPAGNAPFTRMKVIHAIA